MTTARTDAHVSRRYIPRLRTDMEFSYRLIRTIFRAILTLLCRLRVEGLERLPRRGPLILLTNHLHFLDPPVVLAVLPVRTMVLAAEKWETRPIINRLFKAVGAVFIHRGASDIGALRAVESLLRQGAIVGIAPEGTRSPTGGLQRGKGGAAFLGSRTGATLVPVVVYGQEKVFKALRRLRRADVVLRVGEPFVLPALSEAHRSQQVEALTTDIMLRLARLLPPEYRGVYGPLVD
jgi:1-acyl-sn-glycerol-3-phosphate acyltransferase